MLKLQIHLTDGWRDVHEDFYETIPEACDVLEAVRKQHPGCDWRIAWFPRKFVVACVVTYEVNLPCETVVEARDFLRKNPRTILNRMPDTNVTIDGGIDTDDIELSNEGGLAIV